MTGERTDKEGVKTSRSDSEGAKKSNRAFTLRKFLDRQFYDFESPSRVEDSPKLMRSEIEIEYEPLAILLGEVLDKYTEITKIYTMTSPYRNLLWAWDNAETAANLVDDKDSPDRRQAKLDLKELLRMVATASGSDSVDLYFKERDTWRNEKSTSFASLWALFPRGTLIVGHPYENEPQLFIVRKCGNAVDLDGESSTSFGINCYSYDWDGSTFNRVPYTVCIEPFPDKKKIFELAYYPLVFYQGKASTDRTAKGIRSPVDRLKDELVARGEKFKNYCTRSPGCQTFLYDGTAYHQKGAGLFRMQSLVDINDGMSSRGGDSATSQSPGIFRTKVI